MTWFGVVNPFAGNSGSPYDDVLAVSTRMELDATFVESTSGDDVSYLISDAFGKGSRRFISVGGDGTAHLVLNALMNQGGEGRCTLAIIPAGSGSDFTRTFGHERGIEPGLARVADGDLYKVDIGQVTGSFGSRYFLNALNVGVAAASAATADRFPRWTGSARYRTAFWIALWRFKTGPVIATIDRHRFDGDAINVVVANGQFFGGGLNIAPRATLTDGKMDVQVFRGPRREAFSVMPRILMGSHLTHRAVQRYSGSTIRIEVPDAWPVEADGEMIGTGTIDIAVLPAAIDFVI
ncbi:MAG: diacylglycerol kinase family lipid kinase [Acidimicrobiia bacterium]|nr:MAG: diacylglycerol kinase family lipid kinase [Acidimicrobiia bacterium]